MWVSSNASRRHVADKVKGIIFFFFFFFFFQPSARLQVLFRLLLKSVCLLDPRQMCAVTPLKSVDEDCMSSSSPVIYVVTHSLYVLLCALYMGNRKQCLLCVFICCVALAVQTGQRREGTAEQLVKRLAAGQFHTLHHWDGRAWVSGKSCWYKL